MGKVDVVVVDIDKFDVFVFDSFFEFGNVFFCIVSFEEIDEVYVFVVFG